jgi:predicted nucleic acid-binding protein
VIALARNKAIFDADILINMVKTGSLEYLTDIFEQIYVSDYVWNREIRKGTAEYRILNNMKNKGFIVVLEYSKLTEKQKNYYINAYDILKDKTSEEYVNEGERVTAAFAKAHNVTYYMSDDNKASPFILSLADVEVINYCDLLYIAYKLRNSDLKKIYDFYNIYISLFEEGCLPNLLRDKNGNALKFSSMIAKAYDKFNKSNKLSELLKFFLDKQNH